jgi:hypothetical protein
MSEHEALYSKLRLTDRNDPARPMYVFIEPHTITLSNGFELYIEKGYKTDLATVPKFAWGSFPPQHEHNITASIVHDYLYDNWRKLRFKLPKAQSRKWCDKEFLYHSKMNWRKYVMYFILRIAPKARKMYYD